jgi:hypothetical protein
MRKRRNSAWLIAVVAVLMLAVPVSGAMGFSKAEKKHEKKQNAAIGKASKAAARALARTAALTTTVGDHTKSLADLQTLATGIDNRLKFIETAAPAIVQGLTDLKNATVAGFAEVKATTTAGFDKVTQTFRAVEYGTVGVFGPPAIIGNTSGIVGFPLGTADIPDDGNPVSAAGSIPVDLPVNAATPAVPLTLRGAIRSNESDGAATGDPAGQAGGLLYAVCATAPSCGAGGPPQGTLVCTGAPLPSAPFTVPGGTANLAAVNIQQKSGETDTSAPSNTSTQLTSTGCTLPAGGGLYLVTAQAQFFDLPTSATPSNTD